MRSTLEIIVAVKDSEPVTEEELRMALLVMSGVEFFYRRCVERFVEAAEKLHEGQIAVSSWDAKKTRESMQQAKEADPLVWLGLANIPGTREYEEQAKIHKNIARGAGVEL